MSIKDKIRDWYSERERAQADEQDDYVSDLDEYIIDDLMEWARNDYTKRTAL